MSRIVHRAALSALLATTALAPSWAQAVQCTPNSNTPACFPAATNLKPTDIIVAQQAYGPTKPNQVVHATVAQVLAVGGTPIALVGDITGSGISPVTTTLATTGVIAGPYTNANVTVDAKGRVTAITSGTSAATTTLTGEVVGTGVGTVATTLSPTGVVAGAYTSANITVDAAGRVTVAASGSGGSSALPAGAINAVQYNAGSGAFGAVGPLAANNILVGATGAPPAPSTLTGYIDAAIGSTRGSFLQRSATAWNLITPGTAGQVLLTNGPGADAAWADPIVSQSNPALLNATVLSAPSALTLVPLDISSVTTGGQAVIAIAVGHRAKGGWIYNPSTATVPLCVNEVGTASGTVSAGNTTCLVPGDSYDVAPTSGAVTVISSDSAHAFSGMGYQ